MRTYKYGIILLLALIACTFSCRWQDVSANVDYTGINTSEYEAIKEYINSEEMLHNISFAIMKEVSKDDISFLNCYKMNMFAYPANFNDSWNAKSSISDIYADMWVYSVPIIIRGEKAVVFLKIEDDNYRFSGISRGEGCSVYFVNDKDIEKTLKESGVPEEEVNYADVLYAGFAGNTLFIHINSDKMDYLIPYTAIDLSEFYEESLYKSGEMYETSEVLHILKDSSFVSLDRSVENGGDDLQAQLGGNGHDEQLHSGKDKEDEKDDLIKQNAKKENDNTLMISGILMSSALILTIIAIKIRAKQ